MSSRYIICHVNGLPYGVRLNTVGDIRFMALRLIAGGLTRKTKVRFNSLIKLIFSRYPDYINIQFTDFLTERVPVQP